MVGVCFGLQSLTRLAVDVVELLSLAVHLVLHAFVRVDVLAIDLLLFGLVLVVHVGAGVGGLRLLGGLVVGRLGAVLPVDGRQGGVLFVPVTLLLVDVLAVPVPVLGGVRTPGLFLLLNGRKSFIPLILLCCLLVGLRALQVIPHDESAGLTQPRGF